MNITFHESLEPFKLLDNDEEEKVEAGELLEESWFFGNRSKTKMSRSFSDPCTTTTTTTTASSKSYEEAYKSIKKLTVDDQPGLMKAPSMPPRMERKEDQIQTTKGISSDPLRTKSNRKTMTSSSSMNLLRAPSLPTSMRMTEDHEFQDDEEIEFSMGKLIRQASLNSSNKLPPRTHASKGLTPSSSLSRDRSRRNAPELKSSVKTEKINVKPQRLMKQLKPQKSLSDLETEELQGLKDLGFDFDKKDLSPNVINIIPGLQEKKRIEEEDDQETNRPYLSEAWKAQSSAPPVPKWGGKRSTEEDVKAQIKFWARAVASNVRQEC